MCFNPPPHIILPPSQLDLSVFRHTSDGCCTCTTKCHRKNLVRCLETDVSVKQMHVSFVLRSSGEKRMVWATLAPHRTKDQFCILDDLSCLEGAHVSPGTHTLPSQPKSGPGLMALLMGPNPCLLLLLLTTAATVVSCSCVGFSARCRFLTIHTQIGLFDQPTPASVTGHVVNGFVALRLVLSAVRGRRPKKSESKTSSHITRSRIHTL